MSVSVWKILTKKEYHFISKSKNLMARNMLYLANSVESKPTDENKEKFLEALKELRKSRVAQFYYEETIPKDSWLAKQYEEDERKPRPDSFELTSSVRAAMEAYSIKQMQRSERVM